MKHFLFGVLTLILITPSSVLNAQSPCGNIIITADFYYEGSEAESTLIENCDNPFEKTHPLTTLLLNNAPIQEGSTYPVEESGSDDYGFTGENFFNTNPAIYYRKEGTDYIVTKTEFAEPTHEAIAASITEFFGGTSAREISYREAYFSGDTYSFFQSDEGDLYVDAVTGTYVYEVYGEMEDYMERHVQSPRAPLLSGTYTVVRIDTDEGPTPTLNTDNPFKQLFASLISTAHAYYNVETVTFTLAVPQEPVGASSVLFLPGIMGSRLYEESDVCDSGVSEQQRWFSTNNCDQLRLKTNVAGESINDVYTKAGNESVIDEAYGFNLYKTFLGALQTWKDTDIIADYKAVPYDWRLRLDDILKAQRDTATNQVRYDVTSTVEEGYLYKTLQGLVASSLSGKVTIVAHSNGGLVAKRLLAHLKITNDPLLAKIDNLILVGVPQVGTPSTLLGLLHGDEIGIAGVVVSQQTTRELMNTMPFAFHLLPNQSYFSGLGASVSTPVINFESGSLTTPWANAYGASVTTAEALKTFLSTESARTKPSVSDLATPEVLDTVLFNYAETTDILLNSWTPPNLLKVYQIAGVGLPTQSGITYFTDSKCIAREALKLFKCTTYAHKLSMRPNETVDGDETVVTPSALAMSGATENVERWWLNLFEQNDIETINRQHKDIFEVQDVINFVSNTLNATTTAPYEYLTNTPTILPPEQRLVFNLYSPLDLKVVANGGKEVSSLTETIEGGVYKRFGEMQHISIPDTGTPVTLKLQGTAYGSFTLEVEEYSGVTLDKRHTYSAIPSSTSTEVSMALNGVTPIEELPLVVDYDGNGTPEISYDTEGEIVPEITYTILFDALNALTIKPLYKKLLLENAKIAKQFYEKSLTQPTYKKKELFALNVLKQQILLYERLRVLTTVQKLELVRIVDGLINK